jgi:AcrR family transcriptional regulator
MGADNKELTKDAILNAASQVFGKYGYKKTTLDDITSVLNIGKTAIYYYFKNKEEIFREVIKKEAENLKDTLIEKVAFSETAIEKLTNYAFARMKFLKRIGNYYSALRFDLMEQLDFINESRKDFDKIEVMIVAQILEEGCKSGEFKVDNIADTSKTITLTLKSLEIPFFATTHESDYQSTLKALLNLFLHGLENK